MKISINKLEAGAFWDCPRCGTTHTKDVLICNQWNREGECGYNYNDRPLDKKVIKKFERVKKKNMSKKRLTLLVL